MSDYTKYLLRDLLTSLHVNLSVSISNVTEKSKFLKFKIFNELDRFFSSFQVPVNESARQVCRYLTRTPRTVSFDRVRLRSETFERARPLCRLLARQGGSLEDHTLHPQRRTFTDSIIFPTKLLIGVFYFHCFTIVLCSAISTSVQVGSISFSLEFKIEQWFS